MQFAYAPKKAPASPYRSAPPTPGFAVRRTRSRSWALPAGIVATVIFLIFLFTRTSADVESIPHGTPPVVIVTDLDLAYGDKYNNMIIQNRRAYAAKHGYATFLTNITAYSPALADPSSPMSWSKVPAVRHAMTAHPHTPWFFYLHPHALLMRPDLSLESHLLNRISSLAKINVPVVPPDSVINTVSTSSSDLSLVLTQDHEGLSQHSFLLRRGDWAKFFLDAWFDPLYRSYNFQRAEGHALEHLVQWHGTVLSRLAIVEQRLLNAYTSGAGDEKYVEGDFVAHAIGCEWSGRSCEEEIWPFWERSMQLAR